MPACYNSAAVAEMGDRFATTDVPKMGVCCVAVRLVELGPHPIQIHNVARAEPPRPTSIHTKWHLDTTNMGRKLGAVPLLGWGAKSPSNTMCPGPRPTFVPSGILINPTVWPQCTSVTDSIRRTVLETVAQKWFGATRYSKTGHLQ